MITYKELINSEYHPLLENGIQKRTLNAIVGAMYEFLLELNVNKDRLEAFECRSRSGFSPYSHNHGGLQSISFRSNLNNISLFENAEIIREKHNQYTKDSFLKENPTLKADKSNWTESDYNLFYDYENSQEDDDHMLTSRLMFHGFDGKKYSLTVDLMINVSDAPYFRRVDDLLEYKINFKTVKELKLKLAKLSKNKDVLIFKRLLWDGY